MAIRVIDDTKLNNIAVAIQTKDSGGQMTVDDMPTRIANIPSGGATLIPKTITENGVYNAANDNADGYDVVTVVVTERNTLDEYFADTLEVANIPSATSIAQNCFKEKRNLVNVIMPNVTSIGASAFSGCTNLALTSLPNSLISIPNYAFGICKHIPYLDFSDFTSIPTVTATSFYGTTFPFYFRDQQQLDEWAAATNWSTYADRFQIKPSGVI